jgi:MoaA/NifB/PqqE/SkfB family radical SAM enzyme
MKRRTAESIAASISRLNPNARIEFAMHGEPLTNRDYEYIMITFRAVLPEVQIQVTTNGLPLMGKKTGEKVDHLFRCGVDYIVVDTYEPYRDDIRKRLCGLDPWFNVIDFYDDWAPKGISIYHNHHRKIRNTIVLLDDLSLRSGEVRSRTITNQGGNSPARPAVPVPLEKTCTLPFRELSVCWNGEVRVCCNDWQGECPCGNVMEESLKDIWHGQRFEAARRLLSHKQRAFPPCSKCDIGSGSRSGLLPKYLQPKDTDLELITGDNPRTLRKGNEE